MGDPDPTLGRPSFVIPPRTVLSATELDADRWVLLAPPTRGFTRGWRVLAVFFLALTAAGGAAGWVFDVAEQRAWWQSTTLVLGTLITLAGVAWTWRNATRPRPIDTEVHRLGPVRTRHERRRLARALRRHGTDRPAAAAYAAGLQPLRLQAGLYLACGGALRCSTSTPPPGSWAGSPPPSTA